LFDRTAREGKGTSRIKIDAATFANAIREQNSLPITEAEAESIAQAVETSQNDEEYLAHALLAVRLLVDRLEQSTDDGLSG
jgi:hypothetical protein